MNVDSRKALFLETHKAIAEAAESVVFAIGTNAGSLSYPPGIKLTPYEQEILSSISLAPEAKTVLKKVVADACSYPMFHTLSLLDGVTEPYVIEVPGWEGGSLGKSENGTMLHDEFLEAYWDYDETKKS